MKDIGINRILRLWWVLVFDLLLFGVSVFHSHAALPVLGDLNNDAQVSVLDITRLQMHLSGASVLTPEAQLYADVNQDGLVTDADIEAIANVIMGLTGLQTLPTAKILSTSPGTGEGNVSLTRETIARFSQPLASTNIVTTNCMYAEFGGRRILSRLELAQDRRALTLFYLEPLPSSARVRVTINGNLLTSLLGQTLDADGDGNAGGTTKVDFDTASITPLTGTAVIGTVFASELAASTNGLTNSINIPLAGVTITVDGAEQTLRTVTSSNGTFVLSPCPAGRFFVHVDGRTVTNLPAGIRYPDMAYYPFVGKAWEAVAGYTNNLAGGNGLIYLPLITQGTLQTVSLISNTVVTFPASVIASNPALAGVSISVPAGALYNDSGQRGGKVGIAPVATDRLPEPLPPGLNMPLVITVQTDGPQNFDQPVPICFPNLPNPRTGKILPPGAKTALLSFNHDTGRWEMQGSMTVSADGTIACTDPGVGIRQPGWHGTDQINRFRQRGPSDRPRQAARTRAAASGVRGSGVIDPDYRFDFGTESSPIEPGCTQVTRSSVYSPHIGYGWQAATNEVILDIDTGVSAAGALLQDYNATRLGTFKVAVTNGLYGVSIVMGDALSRHVGMATAPWGLFLNNTTTESMQFVTNLYVFPVFSGILELDFGLVEEDSDLAVVNYIEIKKLGDEEVYPVDRTAPELLATNEFFYAFYDLDSRLTLRGKTTSYANIFNQVFTPANSRFLQFFFLPSEMKISSAAFTTPAAGRSYLIPNIDLEPPYEKNYSEYLFLEEGEPPLGGDSDQDGLSDDIEFVIGTSRLNTDTDGDGISDYAEVRQSTDPLDGRPAITGIIGSATTPGSAVDVCADNDIAITANGSAGIVVFNVVNKASPFRVAVVDTPGNAQRVSCSGNLIAVADGSAGLAVVDVADPPSAFIRHQVNLGGSAQAVVVAGGIAYVGLNSGQIVVVDMASGTIIERITVSGNIQDLAIGGVTLYALTTGTLYALPLDDGELRIAASVNSPGSLGAGQRRWRLFVGGGLAYATHTSGFNIFNLENPLLPVHIRNNTTGEFGWKQIVSNGSGLGVAAVGPNSTDDGPHDVSLYNLGPAGTNGQLLTTIQTPGLAAAVSIYNGLAYVADSTAGLQVINYRAFDTGTNVPAITLTASFPLNPARAEEGKLVRVTAQVLDDVQVRNVEFYLDNVLVSTDGTFPFELRFRTPPEWPTYSFSIRARAFDTGGNFTWSDEFNVLLLPEATPPRVVRTFPRAGSIAGSVTTLVAFFNEPIQTATINSDSFLLRHAGPDGVPGTADDLAITNGILSYRDDLNAAVLSFGTNLDAGVYQLTVRAPLADLAGNLIAEPFTSLFAVIGGLNTDQDGIPDHIELLMGLNPNNPDSDGNGIWDGDEDLDGDGLKNNWEILYGYTPALKDTDGNGIEDGSEDPDFDGLNNLEEQARNTNPFNPDSDGDGWDDATEVLDGTDPMNRSSGARSFAFTSSRVAYLNAVQEQPPTNAFLVSPIVSYRNTP